MTTADSPPDLPPAQRLEIRHRCHDGTAVERTLTAARANVTVLDGTGRTTIRLVGGRDAQGPVLWVALTGVEEVVCRPADPDSTT